MPFAEVGRGQARSLSFYEAVASKLPPTGCEGAWQAVDAACRYRFKTLSPGPTDPVDSVASCRW
ncbi:hypothetical protein PSCICG_46660 [Pseudomonas cichorii]|nr:hypothetical protein PSCICG_46660 [Pseudomonas cichorii]